MSNSSNARKFLGTTALYNYWSVDDSEVLLAGEWCRPEIQGTHPRFVGVLPYLWSDAKDVYCAQMECERIYNRILPILRDKLNEYRDEEQSLKYYHILIGNWLVHFIHQAYDKFEIINTAITHKVTSVVTIPSHSIDVPINFREYARLQDSDHYQLHLFSEIARFSALECHETMLNGLRSNDQPDYGFIRVTMLRRIFFNLTLRLFTGISNVLGLSDVVIVDPYFKRNKMINILKVFFKSRGRLVFDYFDYNSSVRNNINLPYRNSIESGDSNIDTVMSCLALRNIPRCYLEDWRVLEGLMYSKFSNGPMKFFTYNSLYHNELFQFFVAAKRDSIRFSSAQHGSAYGIDLRHEGEVWERSISDIFYTYGWKEDLKTRPLEMPQVFKQSWSMVNKKNRRILFVTTTRPRYISRFNLSPNSTKNLKDHVENVLTFLGGISQLSDIVMRHHHSHDERGWNNRQRIKAQFAQVKDDKFPSFYDSVERSRFLIVDHLGTTVLEAIQFNIPFIVLIDPTSYHFRDSFKNFRARMIENRILFESAEDAAQHFNTVIQDPTVWWLAKETQDLIEDLRVTYAKTSDTWIDDWIGNLCANDGA